MKKIDKHEVLKLCIQKQQEIIENYNLRINDLKEDIFKRNSSASQSEDRKSGKIDILDALEKELVFSKKEFASLDQLDASIKNSEVSLGAIVMTDHLNFFIGISMDKIEIDGKILVGISTNAPIFSSMEGLHKKESFIFNEKTYHIEEVY